MYEWKVIIEAWPYAGFKDHEIAPRRREFLVGGSAGDFDIVRQQAEAFQRGIKSHDKVWKAPILSIQFLGAGTT